MEEEQTILAILAHPDDEVFGLGGTLALYGRQGVRTALVCATRGEVGEIAEGTGATPETLGQVREEELRCAADTLGINEVVFLDYRDSGMDGTPENKDPRAFMNAPAEEVVTRLSSIIREIRPTVVITFDPYGGYGHPDHIAIHNHTLAAFDAAGDSRRFSDSGPAWQPDRLFYAVITRSQVEEMRKQMEAAGQDVSNFEENLEQGQFGWPDDDVHLTIDAEPVIDEKLKAFGCHKTQFGGRNLFSNMPEAQIKEMIRYEHLVMARPEPAQDLVLTGLL